MQLAYQAERLGISFEVIKIFCHAGFEHLRDGSPVKSQHLQIPLKPFPDGDFPEMSKRRIPDIMDQPRALKDMTDILLHPRRKSGISPVF